MRLRAARYVLAVVVSALALSACGTQSEHAAIAAWVKDSAYVANNATLIGDARHAATVLRNVAVPQSELHTVCAVMLVESEEANAALPSPDDLANRLLAHAYGSLGAGANLCYVAGASASTRARALRYLASGVGQLAEASARITSDLNS